MHEVYNDPVRLQEHLDRQDRFDEYLREHPGRSACANPVTIPVAIHFQGVSNPNRPCLESLAQDQIDIINADFQGINVDISNWDNGASSFFPGVANGDVCLAFCLATQNHPSGYGLSNGQPAVTINQTSGSFESDWNGYLNVYVRNYFALGSSPLGGSGNGDGVIVDNNAFGSGGGCSGVNPNAPFNRGRTLTHELGHYFNLYHIWRNGCGSDDNVSDTPNSSGPYYNCPNNGASSCGSTDMHMNYMDYVDDQCMYMFSSGQANRMESYVNVNLQNLVNNASSVCGDSSVGGGCAPESFVDVPTGLSVSFTSNQLTLSWDPYPDSRRCQIRGNKSNSANDGSFFTGSWNGDVEPSSRTFSLSQVSGNTEYRWRVRCGCRAGGTTIWSPYSDYDLFLTPPGMQQVEEVQSQLFKRNEESGEKTISLFPNPSTGLVTVEFHMASTDMLSINLIDLSGRIVFNESRVVSPSDGSILLDFSGVDSGTYLLLVEGDTLRSKKRIVLR